MVLLPASILRRRPHKLYIACFRLRPKSALIPLLVLSKSHPLCWAVIWCLWPVHFATFPHYGGKARRFAAVGASVHRVPLQLRTPCPTRGTMSHCSIRLYYVACKKCKNTRKPLGLQALFPVENSVDILNNFLYLETLTNSVHKNCAPSQVDKGRYNLYN